MSYIRVYKTTVKDVKKADSIKSEIRKELPGSDPSFDLEDVDKVLRVERPSKEIEESEIRRILKNHQCTMSELH